MDWRSMMIVGRVGRMYSNFSFVQNKIWLELERGDVVDSREKRAKV